MAKYFRYFETIAEFESAYTGEEYVEPFVAYIEENQGVAFNKAQLLNIEIVGLAMRNDVPATGKTVDKNDCEYTVLGFYDDSTEKDITDEATVTGSLVVGASQIEERHSAGTLTLTATYDGFESSKSVVVFQEAFVPSVTAITLDDLTWVEDIPAEGGTATKDNCSYTVTAYYDNGNEVDVTDEAVVTGSLVVEESELEERHSAGTLTLTATYSGFNDSDSVTVWQEAAVSYLTFNITSGGDISWGCIGESGATIEYKKNNGEWTEITATELNPKTMTGGTKINVVTGDKVKFRGDNATYSPGGGMPIGSFITSTAGFTLEGNIMSLIDSVNYKEITGMTNDNVGAFASLFSMCTGLTSAENLILPATTLAESCYGYMFGGCSSLTTAPELPATTLTEGCYSDMFAECTSLSYIKCLATDISANNCTGMWVANVSYSGTFIKNPTMNDWEIDSPGGIPEGWSVYDRDPLKLSVTQVSFAESGDSCTITVKSPTSAWTATSEDSWISLNKTSGNTGETSVIVSASSGTKRVGEVLFTDGYSQATLTVVQNNDYLVPLTFNILSNGEVGFAVRDGNGDPTISGSIIEYKINNGNWTSLTARPFTGKTEMGFDSKFSVNAGDVVQFRGDNKAYAWYDPAEDDFYQNWFVTSAEFNLAGNIMSLTNSTDFIHNGNMGKMAFSSLFGDCENLVSAENLILPATTLANDCYQSMFMGCTSLTIAPVLPAATMVGGCYSAMFAGCISLSYIKCLATDISASDCTDSWVNDVAPTGIFIMNQNATDWEIGDNGIPIGWVTGDTEDTFITSDEITLSESGGSESASVYSTANPWTASTVDSWITLGANTGDTGLTNLTITAQSSTSVRTGSVTLTDGNMTKTVNVIQDDKAIFTKQPLTFNIICGGTIYLKASGTSMNYTYIDYTSNDDNSRTSVYFNSSNPSTINVNAGDKIKFFGNNSHYGTQSGYYQHYCYFSASTGTKFEIEGNIMSLVDDERFVSTTTLSDTYTFCGLFAYCGGLTSAENLILPATALTSYCYTSLFQNCTNLTGTPELPATALTDTYGCYGAMFQGCTSLTTAPALPATTLSGGCYQYMFSGCTNLTTAPELPATTLMESCYFMMFHNCTNLNYIKCLATDISEVSCTTEWVNGVASTGTFVKPNATDWSSKTGNAGIPANWTVEDAS